MAIFPKKNSFCNCFGDKLPDLEKNKQVNNYFLERRKYHNFVISKSPPENLIAEKEKIYKLKPLGYLYLDIQGILKSHVPKSGW